MLRTPPGLRGLALQPRGGYRSGTVNPVDSSELIKARDLLLSGEVVAIPTETVYGLAASIESEAGIRKIFSIKERPFFDPLIVHVSSFKQARGLVKSWPPLADFLTRMFWPGPLTIVLPKADHVNPLITSGLDTVAIRYPAHPLTLDLLHLTEVPLAAPSANKFGRTSPSKAEHVRMEFPGTGLMILDGGECNVGVESTVIAIGSLEGDREEVRVLRPGGVTEEMLSSMLEKWSRPVTVKRETSSASPGSLKHHYMPKIPVIIVSSTEPAGLSQETKTKVQRELNFKIQRADELILSEDPALAARELYSELRRLSEGGADAIYVRAVQDQSGLWSAIWDRLSRAASLRLAP